MLYPNPAPHSALLNHIVTRFETSDELLQVQTIFVKVGSLPDATQHWAESLIGFQYTLNNMFEKPPCGLF